MKTSITIAAVLAVCEANKFSKIKKIIDNQPASHKAVEKIVIKHVVDTVIPGNPITKTIDQIDSGLDVAIEISKVLDKDGDVTKKIEKVDSGLHQVKSVANLEPLMNILV